LLYVIMLLKKSSSHKPGVLFHDLFQRHQVKHTD